MAIVSFIAAHYQAIAAAAAGICLAIDGVLVLVPGANPMMFKGVADFLEKLSIGGAPKV